MITGGLGRVISRSFAPLLLVACPCGAHEPAVVQSETSRPPPDPVGRWAGSGIEVDGAGYPIEVSRIELEFDGSGVGKIVYPTLGCAGTLTKIGVSNTFVEYRELLTSGVENCPSGGIVSLRAAGNRWIYNWSIQDNWLSPDSFSSQAPRTLEGTRPAGDWVRTGVLSSRSTSAGHDFPPRNPSATVDERIAAIENGILPAVMVAGEPVETATLANRMSALHVPGLSVAVIRHGRIDWSRNYGVARAGGDPVTDDTLFQAASISKPVTAAVTLHVVAQRGMDLDADVNTYLKSWKVPPSELASERYVTLRGLLTHTSGISLHGFAGYVQGAPIPDVVHILDGESPAHSAPVHVEIGPGTMWSYSGGGYVIVRRVLEDTTGQRFSDLAHDTVLAPAGMTRSTFEQPLPEARMRAAASPHDSDGQPLKEGAHIYPEVTPDGLWTTATDLAHFALSLQASLRGDADTILPQAAARAMLEPGGLANWGLGIGRGGTPGHRYFWHSGSNSGFKSNMVAYDDGDGVVVMTNSDSGSKIAWELIRTIAYEYGWPDFRPEQVPAVPLSIKQLDRLCGRYRLGTYETLTIERQGDQLFVTRAHQSRFRIYAKNGDEWFGIDRDGFVAEPYFQIKFREPVVGGVSGLIYREDGVDTAAQRLTDAEARTIAIELEKRVRSQTPLPGAETILRGYIDDLSRGQPDFSRLSPGAAYTTRQTLLNYYSQLRAYGALESLTFKNVSAQGEDVFVAKFERGTLEAHIILAAKGTVELVKLSPEGGWA